MVTLTAAAPRRRRERPGRRLIGHDRTLGARFVAGADEAGRGCLAGPLVAAGVLLDLELIGPREVRALGLLDDSKRHDEASRERLYDAVLAVAARVTVIVRPAATIDRVGLHRTNLTALHDALTEVAVPGAICLSDGFAVGEVAGCETRALLRGDSTSAAIAAASIVAKVSRDRMMHRLARDYPQWGFDRHVGYSTPDHRAAIAEHGITPLHRRSFASVAYRQLTLDEPAGT